MGERPPRLPPGGAVVPRPHFTGVVIVAELFATFGSGVTLAALAVFVTEDVLGEMTLITISAVALCPCSRKPRLHVTVPVVPAGGVTQLPLLDDALTSSHESAAGTVLPAAGHEPDALMAALDTHGGNIVRAAKQMGISRARAYRLMVARGIDVQRYRRRAVREQV